MDISTLETKLMMLGKFVSVLDDKTLISRDDSGSKLYRLLDTSENYKCSEVYSRIRNIKGSDSVIVEKNGSTGIIKKTFETVIKPIYKDIKIYEDGFILLSDGHTTGVVYKTNRGYIDIVPMIYRGVLAILNINGIYYFLAVNKQYETIIYRYDLKECIKLSTDIKFIVSFLYDNLIVFRDSMERLKVLNLIDETTKSLTECKNNDYLELTYENGETRKIVNSSSILTVISQ